MADRYWVGGTGTWNTSSTTNWSASSGGSSGASVPTSADDVFFNASSGSGTVSLATGIACKSWTTTGSSFAFNPPGSAMTVTISGNLTFSATTTFNTQTSASSNCNFQFNDNATITTNNIDIRRCQVTLDGVGKTFTLGSDITVAPNGTNTLNGRLTLTNGTFDAAGYNVSIGPFLSNNSNTRTLTMGSGTWTLKPNVVLDESWNTTTTTNLTFNRNTAKIVLDGDQEVAVAKVFNGGGLSFGQLEFGGTLANAIHAFAQVNTFTSWTATNTTAFTIQLQANQTIDTWSVSGTSGNLVTVNSNTAGTARTLTITNQTSGIDYLDVRDITSNLAPVTFYAGTNTRLRSNVQGVAAVGATANQFVYVLTSGTSFTTPANWNNSNNNIYIFGAGGGGGGGNVSGNNKAGGGGGGGGGYTLLTNQTISGSISYAIGAGGAGGATGSGAIVTAGTGGSTTWNTTNISTGGLGGSSTSTVVASVGGTGGTGTSTGGTGGVGATSTAATTATTGGGGAGAAGTLGAGANGGNGATTAGANNAGAWAGGGGGNGGGTAGGNATASTIGGNGGNNNGGIGGATASSSAAVSGFNGGGGAGGGGATPIGAGSGGTGTDISTAGMGSGGGMGGQRSTTSGASAGLFGGGGGGSGVNNAGVASAGTAGAQGGIVIVYAISATPVNSNFFLMFA